MSNPRRFNSQEYLDQYVSKGIFPKIHDDIAHLIEAKAQKVPAMDFGSCIGLLSVRLVEQLGMPLAIGIEPNMTDYDRAIYHPNVTYLSVPVNADHLGLIETCIRVNGVKLLVARRVISEIGFDNFAFMPVLSEALARSGVKEIVLEGRAYTPRATHPIPGSEKECELLSSHFDVMASYKNCRYLRVRDH